jgi:hypothetical protein
MKKLKVSNFQRMFIALLLTIFFLGTIQEVFYKYKLAAEVSMFLEGLISTLPRHGQEYTVYGFSPRVDFVERDTIGATGTTSRMQAWDGDAKNFAVEIK